MKADFSPLVFLLVILASVANWIFRAIKEKGNDAEAPRDIARPAPGASEEERMRKFLEALGVPSDAPPPAPIQRPAAPPPLVISPPPAMPAPQPTGRRFSPPPILPVPGFPKRAMARLPVEPKPVAAEELQPGFPRSVLTPLPPPVEFPPEAVAEIQPLPAATAELAERFEAITNSSSADQSTREIAATNGTTPAQWAALLKDRNELRKAILLREIFGPPRSLQSTF